MIKNYLKFLLNGIFFLMLLSCSKMEICTTSYDQFIPIHITDLSGKEVVAVSFFTDVKALWPEKAEFGQLDSLPILTYKDTAIYILTKDSIDYKCTILVDKELYYHSRACGFFMQVNDVILIESEYPGMSILPPSEYDERPFWVLNINVDSL